MKTEKTKQQSKHLYEYEYSKDMHISVPKGNEKIGKGIYVFNLMPGSKPISTKDKGELTNIVGTCTGCCKDCENNGCYAIRDARRHHNSVIPSLAKNTLIMRNDQERMFSELKQFLTKKKVKTLRMHSSGEIESYEYLLKMVNLAKELPNTIIYFYTKRFDWVNKYLKENKTFPTNLVCNISKWHNNIDSYNFEKENKVNIFAYDDGTDPELSSWIHCPAVDKKGHKTGITCSQCQRCARNEGLKTAVYPH